MKNLFIGAEGTLGIVTAATLKLFPLAKTVLTAMFALDDPLPGLLDAPVMALRRLRR